MFRMALVIPSVVMYCGMRAVQKRSWWRVLLWSLPTFLCSRVIYNGLNMMSVAVISMHLQ